MPETTLHLEPPETADAAWCLSAYFAELAVILNGGFDPARAQPVDLEDMRPPKGWFILARIDGQPVGCGLLKRVDAATGEIKRVWTAPNARGQGVGRAVMQELERIARDAGFQRVRLDSNAELAAAQVLYRRLGYQAVPRFNDDPYPTHFYAREL